MASVGDTGGVNMLHHTRVGSTRPRERWFVDLFGTAYVAELAHFVAAARGGAAPESTVDDARAALVIALAAVRSAEAGRPVRTEEITP